MHRKFSGQTPEKRKFKELINKEDYLEAMLLVAKRASTKRSFNFKNEINIHDLKEAIAKIEIDLSHINEFSEIRNLYLKSLSDD